MNSPRTARSSPGSGPIRHPDRLRLHRYGRRRSRRRDQSETNFTRVVTIKNVATLQYTAGSAVGDHYWKQGLYRGPHVNGRTDTFHLGPTARGSSFDAVVSAAFGASAGGPRRRCARKFCVIRNAERRLRQAHAARRAGGGMPQAGSRACSTS